MPSRNIVRPHVPQTFYHFYNRGVNKEIIFRDNKDKDTFLSIFDRYLNPNSTQTDYLGKPYPKFNDNIEIQCFCLMDNHYHFLCYLDSDTAAFGKLMKAVGSAYTRYFNARYDRIGPLFQSRFKANLITSDEQLMHTSRYIHLNHENSLNYEYSSIHSFLGGNTPVWMDNHRLLECIQYCDYFQFLQDVG